MHKSLAPGLFRGRLYFSSCAGKTAGLDLFLDLARWAIQKRHDPLLIEH
jgi:hypothetical protein